MIVVEATEVVEVVVVRASILGGNVYGKKEP